MKTLAYEIVGQTLVAVQGAMPPTDEEWEVSLQRMARRDFKSKLVWTLGGAPTSRQRQRTREVLGNETEPMALVTNSAVARAALGIMGLFFKSMKAFGPEQFEAALIYLQVPQADRPRVIETLRRLSKEVGVALELTPPIGGEGPANNRPDLAGPETSH